MSLLRRSNKRQRRPDQDDEGDHETAAFKVIRGTPRRAAAALIMPWTGQSQAWQHEPRSAIIPGSRRVSMPSAAITDSLLTTVIAVQIAARREAFRSRWCCESRSITHNKI